MATVAFIRPLHKALTMNDDDYIHKQIHIYVIRERVLFLHTNTQPTMKTLNLIIKTVSRAKRLCICLVVLLPPLLLFCIFIPFFLPFSPPIRFHYTIFNWFNQPQWWICFECIVCVCVFSWNFTLSLALWAPNSLSILWNKNTKHWKQWTLPPNERI